MLFIAERHEPLQHEPWDASRALALVSYIVSNTKAAYSDAGLWPSHPHDVERVAGQTPVSLTNLYFGACGVLWLLGHLDHSSFDSHRLALAQARHEQWLIERGQTNSPSYLMGMTPFHLMACDDLGREARSSESKLERALRYHITSPAMDLMWGSPGTMLAAYFMHEKTGEERWAALFRDTAAQLWSALQWSDFEQCHFWTQDLYGRKFRFLDGIHGFFSNVVPIIRGRQLLDSATWEAWQQCISNTIRRTATIEGSHANWRIQVDRAKQNPEAYLMQFCHGAPGFIIDLADFPSSSLDDLLVAAGNSVWDAGPLAKGSNLCHGTSGNGYAFLKLYERTGQTVWLERARAFAMHAIRQVEADERQFGQLRYSLWTGDLGVAHYLVDCVQGTARFPTLDVFFPT